ncbi:MAG: type II toxin-antitoxin system RelE/ParE family toxin [Elusimicrobiota bacterium]
MLETDSTPLQTRLFVDDFGRSPFVDWKGRLAREDRIRIEHRIERLASGNLGDWRPVGDGVVELRIDYGPGYRIYIGRQSLQTVVLLGGGNKSTQEKDIRAARARWARFRRRPHADHG